MWLSAQEVGQELRIQFLSWDRKTRSLLRPRPGTDFIDYFIRSNNHQADVPGSKLKKRMQAIQKGCGVFVLLSLDAFARGFGGEDAFSLHLPFG